MNARPGTRRPDPTSPSSDAPAGDAATDDALAEAWLSELGAQQRYSGHTIAAYRRDLRALRRCFPGQPLDTL
ncbi:MAG: site-specific integrase, partial [Castellaniella sp.]